MSATASNGSVAANNDPATASNANIPRGSHGSRVPDPYTAAELGKAPVVVPDPALTPVPDELRAAIEAKMALYPEPKSAAIPALHLAQERYGWCSPEAITQVACVMRVTPAYLTSVASFYDMFRMTPQPAHEIYVCTNITCGLLGGDELCERMQAAAQAAGDVYVREFECLGACDMAPMASVDGEYVGPLDLDSDPAQIIADLQAGRPVLPAKQLRNLPSADPKLVGDALPTPAPDAEPAASHEAPDDGAKES